MSLNPSVANLVGPQVSKSIARLSHSQEQVVFLSIS